MRPAEADAWHHVYGDSAIVDVSSIPDERSVPLPGGERTSGTEPQVGGGGHGGTRTSRSVEELVRQARELADRPSPYTRGAASELWRQAGEDAVVVQSAIGELVELLAKHDRTSAGAADSEWLQLITAKRLLADGLALGDDTIRGGDRRAVL